MNLSEADMRRIPAPVALVLIKGLEAIRAILSAVTK